MKSSIVQLPVSSLLFRVSHQDVVLVLSFAVNIVSTKNGDIRFSEKLSLHKTVFDKSRQIVTK